MANDTTRDWLHNQPFDKADHLNLVVNIHRIFPKAWCKKNGIDPELRESVVNKSPLAQTNLFLGGSSPINYMKRLDAKVEIPPADLDDIVSEHQISTAELRAGNFNSFSGSAESPYSGSSKGPWVNQLREMLN